MENKKIKLKIHGMHCASCEVLVERKLSKVAWVKKVNANHISGKAEIIYSGNHNISQLNDLVKEDGYNITLWDDDNGEKSVHKNSGADYLTMVWMFLAIVAIYSILKQFDILPNISISGQMNYGLVFLIGLFAAVSSCIAVTGGLLLAIAGKYSEAHPNFTGLQKFKPHIYFNMGRIIGYTVFGALVGLLGSTFVLSPKINGYLIIVVSMVMLVLGFQLLNMFPRLKKFVPRMPKFIGHKIHDLSSKGNKSASFTLGAFTFFLPCGFTQALQLYVLANGNWKVGALTMLVFSLGTLPALISLSAISSFAKGIFKKYFLRFAGVLIVMISLLNVNNGFALAGYDFSPTKIFAPNESSNTKNQVTPKIVDGKQIIKMKVSGYTYSPNKFTVISGIPVEWQIDGAEAAGCGKVLVMPTLGISKYLSPNEITIVNFTPKEIGSIPFNCSMGMMTRGSEFNVIPNTNGAVGAEVEQIPDKEAITCDPKITSCLETQKFNIEVSKEKGIYPRSITIKNGIPVELTIDTKTPLGGCMSVWVIPKYNVTVQMNSIGKNKVSFTPTESGTIYLTCSMGSKLVEIIVED